MDVTAKQVGEFLAYGTAVAYAFFKIFQNLWQFLKKLFVNTDSSDKGSKGNTINVNVGKETEAHGNTQNEITSHSVNQIIRLLLEQANLFRTLDKLGHDTLKDQMDFFDKQIDLFKLKLTMIIMDIMKTAGLDDTSYTTYFSNFENFIDSGEHKIRDRYRQMCKQNHFTQYSSSEFRQLTENNTKILSGITSEMLRKNYPQRIMIKDFNRIYDLKKDLESTIILCLNQAREVAEEREERANELVKEFECKVVKVTNEPFKLNLYDI